MFRCSLTGVGCPHLLLKCLGCDAVILRSLNSRSQKLNYCDEAAQNPEINRDCHQRSSSARSGCFSRPITDRGGDREDQRTAPSSACQFCRSARSYWSNQG